MSKPDFTPEDMYHNVTTAISQSIFCYRGFVTSSSGIWIGDNPLSFSFPLLLFQITTIFVATRLTHSLLRRLSIPLAISQILAGILLGPSFLGRYRALERLLFSERSWEQLNTISNLAWILFLFVVGVKTDLSMLRRSGKKAFAIGLFSYAFPVAAVITTYYTIHQSSLNPYFLTNLISNWALTSYVVVSTTLHDLHLLTSKLGRLAISATLISDFAHLFLSAAFTAYNFGTKKSSPLLAVASIAAFCAFWVFVLLIARPIANWIVRRTPENSLLEESHFLTILILAVLAALFSEAMGYHLTMGPFMLGLALPGGKPLGTTMVERLDRLITGVFLPVFVASSGLRMDLASLSHVRSWGIVEIFIAVTVVAKLLGVMLPCLYCKMSLRDSLTVGLMMSIRGILEVGSAAQWQESRIVGQPVYTAVILTIVFVGGGTAPLIKYIYRPDERFVTHKRRTVQHCRRGDELRVVACVHSQDHVAPQVALLESAHATRDSPICVYVLHLTQLEGRTATVLQPHKRNRAGASETDRIVNAFGYLEQQFPQRFSVLPYVCISPYATMHEDVCSLALDKKAAIVIVPFHRRSVDGGPEAWETINPAVHAVNVSVLRYAPCSVGILVDHGLAAAGVKKHVGVYFFGGADDREALAVAGRMGENVGVRVTVVRFKDAAGGVKGGGGGGGREEMLDEEVLGEFREGRGDGKRVVCREEVVRDGEGTVGVIKSMSGMFSLLVVGRREGTESPLTQGLSTFSEYPVLGLIGDLLASTDFAGWVSTLVVQQQARRVGVGGWYVDSPRAGMCGREP